MGRRETSAAPAGRRETRSSNSKWFCTKAPENPLSTICLQNSSDTGISGRAGPKPKRDKMSTGVLRLPECLKLGVRGLPAEALEVRERRDMDLAPSRFW